MRKRVKNNVSWVGYMDWELETFHGDILLGNKSNNKAEQENVLRRQHIDTDRYI